MQTFPWILFIICKLVFLVGSIGVCSSLSPVTGPLPDFWKIHVRGDWDHKDIL